jgi:inosine/xanthosine triphosphatase
MKVLVASQNPVKLNAVKRGFEQMFPGEDFEVVGASISSGVSDQPMGDKETYQGAYNRSTSARSHEIDADYYVGIEGGIHDAELGMQCFAWMVVQNKAGRCGHARAAGFILPEAMAELVRGGEELGMAHDMISNRHNSKQEGGCVGMLTGERISREEFYVHPMVLALIPFANEELYPHNESRLGQFETLSTIS